MGAYAAVTLLVAPWLPRLKDRPILDSFGVWRVIIVGLARLALPWWAFV